MLASKGMEQTAFQECGNEAEFIYPGADDDRLSTKRGGAALPPKFISIALRKPKENDYLQ